MPALGTVEVVKSHQETRIFHQCRENPWAFSHLSATLALLTPGAYYWTVFCSSIPGLYPPDARSTLPPVVTIQSVSQHGDPTENPCRGGTSPWLCSDTCHPSLCPAHSPCANLQRPRAKLSARHLYPGVALRPPPHDLPAGRQVPLPQAQPHTNRPSRPRTPAPWALVKPHSTSLKTIP